MLCQEKTSCYRRQGPFDEENFSYPSPMKKMHAILSLQGISPYIWTDLFLHELMAIGGCNSAISGENVDIENAPVHK